ncbi:MAG: metal-dependent phosphohydrolase [Planctomycetes bacterium]|nr:metal-dependent phosphohydrolase [Planctomycetota bacterium]
MNIRAHWVRAAHACGIDAAAAAEGYAELRRRYAEPQRAYHTWAHLQHLFDQLAPAGEELPCTTCWAGFYHDAVYDPHAKDNEAASARLASERLNAWSVEALIIEKTARLIEATADHLHARAEDGETARFLDADLSILGAAPEAYLAYAQAVRGEYAFVPEAEFRAGRTAFLKKLLDAPKIFRTPAFAARLEGQARANIENELSALNAS